MSYLSIVALLSAGLLFLVVLNIFLEIMDEVFPATSLVFWTVSAILGGSYLIFLLQ